jgi:hypothetical protein
MKKEKRKNAQSKLSAEKLVERHFNEVQTRYSLVKGERIICLSIPLPLFGCGNVWGRATRFCILFRWRVPVTFTRLVLSFHLLSSSSAMSDEQLKLVASSTINGLFSSGKTSAPISSMDLLSRVISSGPPSGLLPTPPPRFRLTDLPKFESILDSLSQNWDQGMITLARDDGGLTVMDVHLGSPGSVNTLAGLTARKRKRVIDEDADSAAGNDDEQDSFEIPAGSTTLGSLSKELKEVYTILQKSTAKGRLLAEQVCILIFFYRHDALRATFPVSIV